jgi:hypothetical protein
MRSVPMQSVAVYLSVRFAPGCCLRKTAHQDADLSKVDHRRELGGQPVEPQNVLHGGLVVRGPRGLHGIKGLLQRQHRRARRCGDLAGGLFVHRGGLRHGTELGRRPSALSGLLTAPQQRCRLEAGGVVIHAAGMGRGKGGAGTPHAASTLRCAHAVIGARQHVMLRDTFAVRPSGCRTKLCRCRRPLEESSTAIGSIRELPDETHREKRDAEKLLRRVARTAGLAALH